MSQPLAPQSLASRVRLIQIQTFWRNTRGNAANSLVAALLIALTLQIAGTRPGAWIAWLGLITIAIVAISLWARSIGDDGLTIANCQRIFSLRFRLGSIVAGCYGAAVFLLPPTASIQVQLVLFVILTGIVTVSSLGFVVMPNYYSMIAAACMLPFTAASLARYIDQKDDHQLLLAAISLAWSVLVVRRGRALSQTVIDAIMINERMRDEVSRRTEVEAELTAAKTAAETANLVKSRFLAAASHDLRQPMQAISLFNEALARTGLNGEQQGLSDHLSQSVYSLGDLLDTLLDISKLDAGAVTPSLGVVQAETLLRKIDADYSAIARAKALRFKFHFPSRDMAVLTDGGLLMSLLGNLIGNAIKYTARGGILIAFRRRGGQALIQVWDTGIGIESEHMGSIYEEYFQIGNPERDRSKGLGLGLAIAKRLAKLLDTVLVCRSVPGRGSVFELRLPLAGPTGKETSPTIEQAAPGDSGRIGKYRIVLIEDDAMVARAIEASLEAIGMIVARFDTAENALADSAIVDADFYITDLRLPGMNGVEFLGAISERSTKPVNAVVLTGDTSADLKSVPWPLLFKPVDLHTLLAAIQSQQPRTA